MKRFLWSILTIIVVAALFSGCMRESTLPPSKPVPVPMRIEVSEPELVRVPTEEIAVPQPVPEPENPEEGLFIIDPVEPNEYLGIEKMRLQRISRDRGELKKLTLVFRNIGPGELVEPIVRFTFSKADVKGNEATIEQDFPLPNIPAGMKLVKEFPIS